MAAREFTVAGEYVYDRRSPVRWIISHILRYPWLPVLTLLGNICSSALYNGGSILIGRAFDLVATPGMRVAELLGLALLVLAARCGVGLTGIAQISAVQVLAERLERDAREELYISLLGKSQTFHNRQQVGDIMARATNDVQQLNLMISPGVMLIVDASMFTIVPLIAIATVRLELLITPLLFLVFFVFALRGYSRALDPVSGALRRQFGMINSRLAEAISGIEVVKGYAQEPEEKRRFSENARGYRDLFVQEGRIKARYLPLLLFGIMFGLGFGHALLLFLNGTLTIGQVVAFMGLLGVLRFPTFISLFSFSLVQLGIAGAERILALINDHTELDENIGGVSQPIVGAITFEGVSFAYDEGPKTKDENEPQSDPSSSVLKGISFTAQPGETVAIVGQTGSGKTTLTKLVNRIYDASDGRVLIDGVDVRDWSMQSLRSQISTIEQDIFLFSRTIGENIAFGAPETATREQIEQAARAAQAHDFIMSFPEGYDTVVGERGVTLSGGQRQRIAIARAFMTDPRILVLDDSTSAIDSATEDEIQRAMRRIMKGRTTLLITHRISQIRWADRILVLRRGELVAQGSHDQLMASSEAYRRLFARYEREPASSRQPAVGSSVS
ncbi:MAG TPA: ABC transporter ATP-binding protein [Roseiflexaceae bacterium]|nr:ABC transporter ATP-binding protein [Roseiflexaceae bacterium]